MKYDFEYRKLGDYTYHLLHDPKVIKEFLMEWVMREWESDHAQAPDEHWTVAWMNTLPKMSFSLQVIKLEDINPNSDLMSVEQFQRELKERADDREESILRGISIEPLLVNDNSYELMDGYTRYTVLKRYRQRDIYAYMGSI
jgi:hypothetical protein